MTTAGSQSKKVTRTRIDGVVRAAAESVGNAKDVIEVTPEASGALQPKARSGLQLLAVAMKRYCFVNNTSFSELEDLNELGSALHRNVKPVLADPPLIARSARGQASCAHDVFNKKTSRTLCSLKAT